MWIPHTMIYMWPSEPLTKIPVHHLQDDNQLIHYENQTSFVYRANIITRWGITSYSFLFCMHVHWRIKRTWRVRSPVRFTASGSARYVSSLRNLVVLQTTAYRTWKSVWENRVLRLVFALLRPNHWNSCWARHVWRGNETGICDMHCWLRWRRSWGYWGFLCAALQLVLH